MKINYVIGAFLCVLGCYGCSSPKTEVKSPDGHIKMALTVDYVFPFACAVSRFMKIGRTSIVILGEKKFPSAVK